jgi:hypothetical protein
VGSNPTLSAILLDLAFLNAILSNIPIGKMASWPDTSESEKRSRVSRESSSQGMKGVELQIQFQNIDAGFTQKSQVAIFGVFPHKVADVVFFNAT